MRQYYNLCSAIQALCRTVRDSLLFCKRLTDKFVDWEYNINTYDWCVANKIIGGKQCMVLCNADYLKFSHVSENTLT